MDERNIKQEFLDAMFSHGLECPDEVIADGKLHRFTVSGDRTGSTNGWYNLHSDGTPAGSFGSWKTGQSETWVMKLDRKITSKEREDLEEKIKAQRKERELEQKIIYEQAAIRAEAIWDHCQIANEHPYLLKKKIQPHGARVNDGALIIPLRNADGKLTTLQFIGDEKKYLTGGEKIGSYFTIANGKPTDNTPILICEGFATGASLHEATGLPTVVAFDTAGLAPTGKILREKFPNNKIIFCADNDQWTEKPVKNPGVYYAQEAAKLINASVVIPQFKSLDTKPTDFNDLVNLEGQTALVQIFAEPKPVVAIEKKEYSFLHIVGDWPFHNGKGKPLSTIENVKHLLEMNKISVRYDMIRKDLKVNIPGESYLIDTERNDKMTRIISICLTAGLASTKVEDFVAHMASQNPYNPVVEWVKSYPWDGVSRLADFYGTVKSKVDSDPVQKSFKETLLKRWMISAVAAAFEPDGVSARGVLVFTSSQYLGKTNWFKNLVPQELKLTKDGMLLRPDDKDSVYQIVSNWLVELGEVDATFRKSDIAQLKAFITKKEDTIRLPYRRDPASFARRTIFFASVNDKDYLADPTGNTRFWTVECEDINHTHGLNMQQVWAEFYEMYKKGESWYLTQEENAQLNRHNVEYETKAPVEELLTAKYDWDYPTKNSRQLTASEIAIELGYRNPTQRETRSISKALKSMNVEVILLRGFTRFKIPDLKTDKDPPQELWPWQK